MNLRDGYCNEKKGRTINWNKRLGSILDGENVEKSEVRSWTNDSGDWVTCAVGNACAVIPRDHKGKPDDPQLDTLGVGFHRLVMSMKDAYCSDNKEESVLIATKAENVLAHIEKRSSELIAEIG